MVSRCTPVMRSMLRIELPSTSWERIRAFLSWFNTFIVLKNGILKSPDVNVYLCKDSTRSVG